MSIVTLPFRLIRRAATRRLFWLGAPLLLYIWTVTGPFLFDDLHLVLKAEQCHRGEIEGLDLFSFAPTDEGWQQLRDRGTVPWWLPETGRADFVRPLANLSFYLDVLLFGRNPLGYRLMSLAIFAIALLCVHWLFHQAGQDPVRAGTATFFFGISQTVTPPVTWMCNRQDLLVLIGVALASAAYWSARARPRMWHLALAAGGFTLALSSKELAVALGAVVVVHELVLRRKHSERRARPMAAIVAGLLLLMTCSYLAFYLHSRPWVLDFERGGGVPSQLGSRLPMTLLAYAAVWTIGFPMDLLTQATSGQATVVAAVGGVLALVAAYYVRKNIRGDRAALFFILWALLFMLPGLRALTSGSRTLCIATLGWSYLLAGLIVPTRENDVVLPAFWRHWFYTTNGIVSVCCVIGTVLLMNHWEWGARQRLQEAIKTFDSPLQSGDTLIMAEAESDFEMVCAGERLEYLTDQENVSVVYLRGPGTGATIERENDHTLLVRASSSSSLFDTYLHRLALGPNWRPRVGMTFRLREFTAEIAAVEGDATVTALRFRFNQPLCSDGLHFYPPETAGKAATE